MGFVFVSLIDDQETILDQISVPINFLEPHYTVSLKLRICKGEAFIYLCFNLQTNSLPAPSIDNLISFGIKWISFDPLPKDDNYFSVMVAKTGLKIGSCVEHALADTRDDTSLTRAFYLNKQPQRK